MMNILFLFLLCFAAMPVWAEKADRDKPMLIEADSASIDDKDKIQTLIGNVIITKGTIRLEAHKVLIQEDALGFQKGTAYQFPNRRAYFRQKREGVDEYIEGKGERIVYDSQTEIAELIGNAWVKSGQDEVKGAYIRYNALNETYFVSHAAQNMPKTADGARNGARVRAIIQPRHKKEKTANSADSVPSLPLKNSPVLH